MSASQWRKIEGFLPGWPGSVGATARDNRTFVNGVLWIPRNSAHWKHLPAEYGNCQLTAVSKRSQYEKVYLRAYESVSEARAGLERYFESCNVDRPHSSLGRMTPGLIYNKPLLAPVLPNPRQEIPLIRPGSTVQTNETTSLCGSNLQKPYSVI